MTFFLGVLTLLFLVLYVFFLIKSLMHCDYCGSKNLYRWGNERVDCYDCGRRQE